MGFKPMLAADCKGDMSLIRTPCLISPKLDGVRCIIMKGVALSRSLKPIPNQYIQDWANEWQEVLEGLDGELIVGSPTEVRTVSTSEGEVQETVMSRTMSGVMRQEGVPNFTFHVFDYINSDKGFLSRVQGMDYDVPHLATVQHIGCNKPEDVVRHAERFLQQGYEGAMTRSCDGLYKQGRSTMKEQGLVKIKLFATFEAEVIGVQELMHNNNEAKENALGNTERSSARAGLVPGGTLGALVCRRPDGVEFNIGTGFTAAQRYDLWSRHLASGGLTGSAVTYRCFEYGSKDAPRFPVFVSMRDHRDIS